MSPSGEIMFDERPSSESSELVIHIESALKKDLEEDLKSVGGAKNLKGKIDRQGICGAARAGKGHLVQLCAGKVSAKPTALSRTSRSEIWCGFKGRPEHRRRATSDGAARDFLSILMFMNTICKRGKMF